jgi:uncharacterized phage protein (TIGR01671 family)
MREIKFRAWHKRHKEMFYYVEHVTHPDGSTEIGYIGYKDEGLFRPDEDQVELMQYTGLKDCKGQDIYEGDIVRVEDTALDAVEYQGASFTVFNLSLNNFAPENVEILGNIYEHPELLKEQ